jgi:chromate reductase
MIYMSAPKILCFAGSTRSGSWNARLASLAAESVRTAGGTPTLISLRDYPMPLFDEDLESASGMPGPATELKQIFLQHQGLVIASPEYNSSISGVLKNTIDWVSRSAPGEPLKAAFLGKTAAIMSASPGGLGGIRGLVHLRSILQNIGILVLPDQLTISSAHQAFTPDGHLAKDSAETTLNQLCRDLVRVSSQLMAR